MSDAAHISALQPPGDVHIPLDMGSIDLDWDQTPSCPRHILVGSPRDPRGHHFFRNHYILNSETIIRSRPSKPNQRKGQNEKFMNFAHFCEFWCFSLRKQARFTLNFCSGMPLRKVHEVTFLWFGLPRPLLILIYVTVIAKND